MTLSTHFKFASENRSNKKPLAVVVKGNPIYLEDSNIKPMADKFYADIQERLIAKGFEVTFDAGEPRTTPDGAAAVWIGHSRGIERLQYAPAHVLTIALETKDSGKHDLTTSTGRDSSGKDPKHYQLSSVDIANLNALKESHA